MAYKRGYRRGYKPMNPNRPKAKQVKFEENVCMECGSTEKDLVANESGGRFKWLCYKCFKAVR